MNFLCNTCLFIAVRMLFEQLVKLQKVQDKWWSNTKFVMYTSLSYAFRCYFYKATVGPSWSQTLIGAPFGTCLHKIVYTFWKSLGAASWLLPA